MAFRVKDLLISLASSADPQECAPPSLECACTGHSTPCRGAACENVGGPYPAAYVPEGCDGHTMPCMGQWCAYQGGPYTSRDCQAEPDDLKARKPKAGEYPPPPPIYTPTAMYCPGCTGHSTGHTTLLWTIWTPWTICPWLSGWPVADPTIAVQQLAVLKAQLKKELAAIAQQEQAVEAQLQPKTVEEIEDLQARLEDALDELERLKADLNRRAGPRKKTTPRQKKAPKKKAGARKKK